MILSSLCLLFLESLGTSTQARRVRIVSACAARNPFASYFQKPENQKRTIWHKLDQDWQICADFPVEHSLSKGVFSRGTCLNGTH